MPLDRRKPLVSIDIMAPKSPIRPAISRLLPNDLGKVALTALGEPDVIALWFGESDLVTPQFIREAAKKALDEGRTFYTNPRGIPPLRKAIAEFHRRTLGIDVALERITVPGAAMLAVTSALECVIETGDNIVAVSPVWPNIFQAAELVGGTVRFAPLEADWTKARWKLDLDMLFSRCDGRTKAIFIASPGNPTGWVMREEEQRALLEFSRARGIAIISDEVYGTLIYDGSAHAPSFLSIAEPDDAVFVINSFSKPWAMTGWRIGWLVHPASLDRQMVTIAGVNNTGATTFAQWGALAALSPQGDEFRGQMLARCAAGREVTQSFLDSQNRIRWIRPEGAFYGFLNIEGMNDSVGFATDLVKRARVGVAPGSAFGAKDDAQLESFVRICFAQDPVRLQSGLERLGQAVSAL